MVQILPQTESFGAAFGRALGGAAKSAASGWADKQAENAKLKRFQEMVSPKENQQDIKQQFLEALPLIEQKLGRELTPQDADQIWQQMQSAEKGQQLQGADPMAQYEASVMADLPKSHQDLYAKKAELAAKERMTDKKLASQQRFAREQTGEKNIEEIQDRLQATEMSDMRQEKLQNLFSKDKEMNFPNKTLVALFTRDGELNPIALSQLSEDAQEAMKLLADEVRGVKDTFGSQITGFEVRRWLARLPSLLNSPEGRRRVTNDLRMMNKFSMDADQGVLDIIDRYGGPGEISLSKAKSIYKKENAQKIKEMRQAFVNPESAEFSELPDASMFPGREAEDPETKQVFKSNGKEWIPQ